MAKMEELGGLVIALLGIVTLVRSISCTPSYLPHLQNPGGQMTLVPSQASGNTRNYKESELHLPRYRSLLQVRSPKHEPARMFLPLWLDGRSWTRGRARPSSTQTPRNHFASCSSPSRSAAVIQCRPMPCGACHCFQSAALQAARIRTTSWLPSRFVLAPLPWSFSPCWPFRMLVQGSADARVDATCRD